MKDLSTTREPIRPTSDDALVDAWRDLSARHSSVSCALDKALQDKHKIGLSEFETLDRLVDSECAKYPMGDLAQCIYLSQSALSRTVARLEKDHLVERTMCSDDRRSVFVALTDAGRARHGEARQTHRAVLADTLTS